MARNGSHMAINSSRAHHHTTPSQHASLSTLLCLFSFSLFPNPLLWAEYKVLFLFPTWLHMLSFNFITVLHIYFSFSNILRKTSYLTPSWNSHAQQIEKGMWVAHAKNTNKLTEQHFYSIWPPHLRSALCPAVPQILTAQIPHQPLLQTYGQSLPAFH